MIYLENTTLSQKVYIPRQAIQTATTREVDYVTSGDVQNMIDANLSGYSTTEQVEGLISAATSGMATEEWVNEQGFLTEHQSLSAYSTTEQMNEAIDAAVAAESARSESTYAKQSDIPDVSDFVTSADVKSQIEDYNYVNSGQVKSQIDERNYVTSSETKTQIEGYNYTTSGEVETQINNKHFVTSGAVNTQISDAIAAETARTEETYLKISDIPDLDDFVTSADVKTQVEQYHYINSADAKTQIDEAIGIESARCESTYLKEHQSLAGLFNSVNYVSSAKTIYFYDKENTVVGTVDATDFIKDGMVDNVYISGGNLVISFNTDAGQEDIEIPLTDIFNPDNYYTKTDIDNKHFVNSGDVKSQIEDYNYITSADAKTQIEGYNYVTSANVKTQVEQYHYINSADAKTQIESELINYPDNEETQSAIDFAIAEESARTEETYAKINDIPDVSNFVTSADVETQITGKNYVTSGQVKTQIEGYGYATTGQVNDAIASESARCESTYLKEHQSLSAYTKTEDFATINGSGITNGGNLVIQGGGESYTAGSNIDIDENNVISVTGITIPDVSDFVTSADVKTQIDGTVSAYTKTTDFATINGSGITNGGNLVIQGGGGGNANIIEITKAEYSALTSYTEDALYVITDADTINMDNYATSADVATKADKSNVAANNQMKFPTWNNQGIITGTTGNVIYQVSQEVNGSSRYLFSTANNQLPTIYAPTTAGSSGQILQSNGSGAPTWSSFKFWYGSQLEYDAITTKDNNTIYFVTD